MELKLICQCVAQCDNDFSKHRTTASGEQSESALGVIISSQCSMMVFT